MYLVVGANGFLGSYILKNILEKTEDSVIAVARHIERCAKNPRTEWVSCDISKWNDVDALLKRVNQVSNLKVVFLAAYHNPDLVEKNQRKAWNINITSLSYFINGLDHVKCLFYPSTDSVYGESTDRYHFREADTPHPVNTYGRQKMIAEMLVYGHGYNVVRYPFLIAPSLSPSKKHFYDQIIQSLQKSEKVEMFADSLRSSLDFNTAASLLIEVIERYTEDIPKILNISGDDDLSKYDIGILIADKLGADRNLIVPTSVESSRNIFEAARAKSTLMDNSVLKEILGQTDVKISL